MHSHRLQQSLLDAEYSGGNRREQEEWTVSRWLFLLPIRWNGFRQRREKFSQNVFFPYIAFIHIIRIRAWCSSIICFAHFFRKPTFISPQRVGCISFCSFPHIQLRIDWSAELHPSLTISATKNGRKNGEIMMHQSCISIFYLFFIDVHIRIEKLETQIIKEGLLLPSFIS